MAVPHAKELLLSQLAQGSPLRGRSPHINNDDVDALVSSLLRDREAGTSSTPGTPGGKSVGKRGSGIDQTAGAQDETASGGTPQSSRSYQDAGVEAQSLSFMGLTTVYEIPVESKPEYISYSKGVQTSEAWVEGVEESSSGQEDAEAGQDGVVRKRRRKLSQREQQLDEEEIRQRLRTEIEAEVKSALSHDKVEEDANRFPARALAPEELSAVTNSNDFLDFVERSSKVIERALDEEYDVLADYALHSRTAEEDDEDDTYTSTRRGRRVKETASFPLTDTMGQNRMLSSLDFSPKFPELLCAAYTKSPTSPHTPSGLLNVWNLHLKTRPEYSLHATSDLLSCLFHPHHPSLILGGTYSGQLCLWDTRARNQRTGEPVQKTPLTGGRNGHAHPIYSLAVVGTQNASSLISASTDGVVCAWSPDMLTAPQEFLELHAPNPSAFKTDDVAPTCISFPAADPTYFLAGTEQGSILPVHRYDRAGGRAGVDARTLYHGHSAPVMGVDFHPARGKMDLGDLFLSCGLDWSVKIWRASPPSTISGVAEVVTPLHEIWRDDAVYDARWSPTRPGIFGTVDGGGQLSIFDINVSTEVPVGSARPSSQEKDFYAARKSLNRLAWEKGQGKSVAVGGLDGVVSVFEVGSELGGVETRGDAWVGVRKWASRAEGAGVRETGK